MLNSCQLARETVAFGSLTSLPSQVDSCFPFPLPNPTARRPHAVAGRRHRQRRERTHARRRRRRRRAPPRHSSPPLTQQPPPLPALPFHQRPAPPLQAPSTAARGPSSSSSAAPSPRCPGGSAAPRARPASPAPGGFPSGTSSTRWAPSSRAARSPARSSEAPTGAGGPGAASAPHAAPLVPPFSSLRLAPRTERTTRVRALQVLCGAGEAAQPQDDRLPGHQLRRLRLPLRPCREGTRFAPAAAVSPRRLSFGNRTDS